MTQNQIIELAHQAAGTFTELPMMDAWIFDDKSLEAFAKLVEEKATKKEQDRCCAIVFAQCDSDNVAQRTVDAIRGQA